MYEVVSHRGWSMASSAKCEEGVGSTYVLAHHLLLPCWSWSQTSPWREMGGAEEMEMRGLT